ncbi:hypothetical protein [Chryseobacterium sp.]|uniref:hypothetical protein n=1 Tax=Chryseobacterium sp. TaxID=1871047 RepID=UPI0012AA419D|nr:hypothetical protein [Chryseobacterium sp.]QFG52782.1 hypothetical protein F7R58_04220 [Chryseobacterium sp.]
MAGTILNNEMIQSSIAKWADTISASNWGGNNLHIDEIDSLMNLERNQWVRVSFSILNIISNKKRKPDSLIPFLHIDLEFTKCKIEINNITLDWLEENIDRYTPPSLHFTTKEYFNSFYVRELSRCEVGNDILEYINYSDKLSFFKRQYLDKDEEMYSNEIYIFID